MALLSRYLQKRRLAMVRPYLQGDVLDLGCAGAAGSELGGSRIQRYVGIDYNPDVVKRLRQEDPTGEYLCRNLDEDELDFDEPFDCVLMTAIIEHLFNQKFAMQQVKRCLKPTGVAVITTPTPLGNDVVHGLGARVGIFARSAMDDHIVIYNRRRFDNLAREVGLSIRHYETFQLGCNQLVIMGR